MVVGGTTPGLVVLGHVRKQARQENKTVSSMLPFPLHQFLHPSLEFLP